MKNNKVVKIWRMLLVKIKYENLSRLIKIKKEGNEIK